MPIDEYFDAVFVINLASRPDRWAHFTAEMEKVGIRAYNRFEGYDRPIGKEKGAGNFGCVASHRGVMEVIAYEKFARALVFEDDATLSPRVKAGEFAATWETIERRLPAAWDVLYLGGHYAEPPLARLNASVIRCGRMHTLSSYAITWQMARKIAPTYFGHGPSDSLFGSFADDRSNFFYIVQPRLFVQYPSYSDLQDREMDNSLCMTDRRHEDMMPAHYVGNLVDYVPPPPIMRAGKIRNPSQHPK